MDNLGEKLFELRKAKNLSQEEVADKLGVTRQSVSKWETNQSTPDFDKIVPLCELFEITTDELLKGEKKQEEAKEEIKKEEKVLTRDEVRTKSAEVVSSSVFTYIVATALFIVAIDLFKVEEVVALAIFLCACGWATARIIKHFMSVPKFEKTKKEKEENEIKKTVNSIVWCLCVTVYFILSFATMAWQVTWIIFIIGAVIEQIVNLSFMLKNEKKEEYKDE